MENPTPDGREEDFTFQTIQTLDSLVTAYTEEYRWYGFDAFREFIKEDLADQNLPEQVTILWPLDEAFDNPGSDGITRKRTFPNYYREHVLPDGSEFEDYIIFLA